MEENKNNLTKNQKLALAGLAIFTILIVVLWIFNLNKVIKGPYYGYKLSTTASSTATNSATDAELKTKDTDGDGLSDYDELNVYHTSPYLEDTDGDGISDGQEVKNGTDPNCPQGKDCSTSTSAVNSATATNATTTVSKTTTQDTSANTTTSSLTTAEQQQLTSGSIDATSLRKVLLENGMDQASLDAISDTDLITAYKKMLEASSTASVVNSAQ